MPTMTPHLSDLLVALEKRLATMHHMLEHQQIEMARMADYIALLEKRMSWNDAQVAQLLRVIAHDLHDVRTTQVYDLISDGPITARTLHILMGRLRMEQLQTFVPKTGVLSQYRPTASECT